jgi:hypothetical protein
MDRPAARAALFPMFVPVCACVVASSTSVPEPLNVSVIRVETVPRPVMVLVPVYRIWFVAGFVDHENSSAVVGSEPPLLFIFSPNGVAVDLLMPM